MFNAAIGLIVLSALGAAMVGWAVPLYTFIRENMAQALGRASRVLFSTERGWMLLVGFGAVVEVIAVAWFVSMLHATAAWSGANGSSATVVGYFASAVLAVLALWVGVPIRNALRPVIAREWVATLIAVSIPVVCVVVSWWCAFALWAAK
ncbi:hypothetical protein LQ938_00950 [Microbacterium sp. cx-55]|uniref:hypothetical protein n=1 Tax=Microbacterium sp. cx-55 TaxID=2875948 RepID=UPI001CC195AC|nr:hypothetical protein [Microbacterium sp. cx-55]MBZ4487374.1 hypothetical protein [Microbacterium sp. cx-55]UGB35394.1 hypothetical protein LQ938_00950 [Microbacterium sp. cx-55]